MRVPVDQPFAAVNSFFLEQIKKRRADGGGTSVIECKASALKIAAASHLLQLPEDSFLVLILPIPNALDQRFAAEVVASFIFILF